jgi:hypothetical protein
VLENPTVPEGGCKVHRTAKGVRIQALQNPLQAAMETERRNQEPNDENQEK